MKKFGTPTRAAPTVASEKLGLVGAGDPSEWVRTGAWTTGTGLCVSSRAAAHSLAEVESEPEMTRSPHLTILPAPEFELALRRFFLESGVAVAVGVAVAGGSTVAVAVGVATVVLVGVGVAVSAGVAVGVCAGVCVGSADAVGAGEVIGSGVWSAATVGSGVGACAGAGVPRMHANMAATATPMARVRRAFTRGKMEMRRVTSRKAGCPTLKSSASEGSVLSLGPGVAAPVARADPL